MPVADRNKHLSCLFHLVVLNLCSSEASLALDEAIRLAQLNKNTAVLEHSLVCMHMCMHVQLITNETLSIVNNSLLVLRCGLCVCVFGTIVLGNVAEVAASPLPQHLCPSAAVYQECQGNETAGR